MDLEGAWIKQLGFPSGVDVVVSSTLKDTTVIVRRWGAEDIAATVEPCDDLDLSFHFMGQRTRFRYRAGSEVGGEAEVTWTGDDGTDFLDCHVKSVALTIRNDERVRVTVECYA